MNLLLAQLNLMARNLLHLGFRVSNGKEAGNRNSSNFLQFREALLTTPIVGLVGGVGCTVGTQKPFL